MARKSNAQQRREKAEAREHQRREAARRRNLRNAGVGIVIVALVAAFGFAIWPESDVGNTTAEAWELPQLDGDGRIALADFVDTGRPTVAAFFASWCEQCEIEFPEYLELSREIGDRVNFVGINSQDNGAGMGDARKWGIADEWPLARDIGNGNGSSLSVGTFGARGMPMTVIYDEAGRAVQVINHRLTPDQLVSILEQFTSFSA